ncbi:MAG: prepilin-type N-terminal cleavage/methylation domain-containing protein [Deltaproteobacteria bacterium]|nr:MAG: prepilin-type N-terminal cleavage/methylation domain-containing protein [Deltaproteobacteria bacterium]
MRKSAGFTLLEVLIAVSVAAIGIVGVLELFSGSSHLARASVRQTDALVLARGVMDETLWRSDLEDGAESGSEGPFRWHVEVEPYEPRLGAPEGEETRENVSNDYELKRVRVRVEWGPPSSPQSVELVSLRVMELF